MDPSAHTLVAQGSPINVFRRSGVLTWAEGARRPGVASVRAPCEEVHLRYTQEASGCGKMGILSPSIPFLVSLEKTK